MRNTQWEESLYKHQHAMITRLDKFRKRDDNHPLSDDEKMAIEHAFQLLIASMMDLARYVLKHHYQTEVLAREDIVDALLAHRDVTFEQAEQIRFLINVREKILNDYLENNFDALREAMSLRRYSLVEALTKEWVAHLS